MSPVPIYASTQAGPVVLDFILDFRRRGWQVVLRPLGQLPAPCPVRGASLRQERDALRQDIKTIGWLLNQYAEHYLLPDACHENGLQADLDASISRLRAVEATLRALTTP